MNKYFIGALLVNLSQVNAFEANSDGDMKIKHEYFKFVAEFGKQLASKEEMDERFEIFKTNFHKI